MDGDMQRIEGLTRSHDLTRAYQSTELSRHGISLETAMADPLISRGLAGVAAALRRAGEQRKTKDIARLARMGVGARIEHTSATTDAAGDFSGRADALK
jgi:hypothetical protein